jgi:hypothetical protein
MKFKDVFVRSGFQERSNARLRLQIDLQRSLRPVSTALTSGGVIAAPSA